MVLAGAGTGKTRTIIERAAVLIGRGVDPARIALMTFTRRAAAEAKNRLETIVGQTGGLIEAGTFHRLCLLSMRRNPAYFQLAGARVIDGDDQSQLMKLARASVGKLKELPKTAALVSILSYARNTNQPLAGHLRDHTDLDAGIIEPVMAVFAEYERRKRNMGYLDYDDILHHFAATLNGDSRVRRKIAGAYDHVLVDEMQDTNPLQWLILEALGDKARLYCVGDDAQSIYAFRGADFENVHSFTERLPDSTIFKLEENYRSKQQVLDLANWLLDSSPLKYGKKLTARRGSGVKPVLLDFYSDDDEAEWLAEDLLRRKRNGAEWSEHMVLARTAHSCRSIEAALLERKIPYRFIGGASLLQLAHVKDVLALVRCVMSPDDELAWTRYLTLWPKIGSVTAEKTVSAMRASGSISGAMQAVAAKFAGRNDILDPLNTARRRLDSPKDAIAAAVKALSGHLEDKYDRWERRRKDFKILVKMAERHRSVKAFLETYALNPISGTEAEQSADCVTLITVHSAKGTECEVCYIVNAGPGMYPHARSCGDKDGIEEERRILYVAMTRAKDELIISRSLGGGSQWRDYNDPRTALAEEHYFLRYVPGKLVDGRNPDDDWDIPAIGGGPIKSFKAKFNPYF